MDQIVTVVLHPGNPVGDEIVIFPWKQAGLRQDFTQKAFGLWAWDAEPTRKIPVELSAALPEEVGLRW